MIFPLGNLPTILFPQNQSRILRTDYRTANKFRYVFPAQRSLFFAGCGSVMMARSQADLAFKPFPR